MLRYLLIFGLRLITISADNACSKNGCTGPFELKFTKEHHHPIAQTSNYVMSVDNYLGTLHATIIEKTHQHLYCYNGGAWDSNTGCLGGITKEFATKEELDGKYCLIGKIPKECDEFWGSDSDICQSNDRFKSNGTTQHCFGWKGSAPFTHHVCVQDWDCHIKEAELPFTVNSNGDISFVDRTGTEFNIGHPERCYVDSNDTSLLKCSNIVFYRNLDPGFAMRGVLTIDRITVQSNATCYNSSNQEICVLVDGKYEGTTVKLKNGEGRKGQMIVTKLLGEHHHSELRKDLQKAASIGDVVGVSDNILFLMEETHYNVLSLKLVIDEMHDIIAKMLESIGKVDDELIPNILQKKGKTKWITPKIFNICPCFDAHFDGESNCQNDYLYKDGRAIKITDDNKDQCLSFPKNSVKFLELTNQSNVHIAELKFPPVSGIASDWDGWTWVANKKDSLLDSALFSENEGNKGGSIINQLTKLDPFNVSLYFKYIFSTTFLVYFNLLLSIYLLCKLNALS
uniref:HP n=1 Tax=Longchuan virus TaxID=2594109 RepID=A0A514YA91_9ORTO|nr:HP [Longchuan virus]